MDAGNMLLPNPCIKIEEVEIKSEVDELLYNLEDEDNEERDKPQYVLIDSKETKSLYDVGDLKQTEIIAQSTTERYKFENDYHENQLKFITGTRMFECDDCDYKTLEKGNLTKHRLSCHPSEVQTYTCDDCEYKTAQKSNLRQHRLRWHTDPSQVKFHECAECDYKTIMKGDLKRHLLKHKDPSQVTMYRCDKCNFVTKHEDSLSRHGLRHGDPTEKRVFECGHCEYKTFRKDYLRGHQMRLHNVASQGLMYRCNECDYKTVLRANLNRHALRHKDPSQVQMYKCSECEYKTMEKGNVLKHQLTHKDSSEVQMHKCDKCNFISKYKRSVRIHQLKHKDPSEVRVFECEGYNDKSIRKSFFKQECKLCDSVIMDGNFEVIEDATRNIFDDLLLKLTLDNETQNVMCALCSSKLIAALNFKSTCLEKDKSIAPYVSFQNPKPVDLKEIYAKEQGSQQGGSVLDDHEVCRLCWQPMSGDHKLIQDVPIDSIQRYIPEINFAATTNPAVCLKCNDTLTVHSTFLRNCVEVEKRRNTSSVVVGDILVSNFSIKTEEIKIKTEPTTTDETVCDVKEDHAKGSRQKDSSKMQTYACEECKFTTKHKKSLRVHQLKHKDPSEVRMFKCNECDYKTVQKKHLKQHQLRHKDPAEAQVFKCDVCDYKSVRKANLTSHQLIHKNKAEVQVYRCDKCDYKNIRKYKFKRHMFIHGDPSKMKMYGCDKCDYKSIRKEHVKQHQLVHTDP